jgi:uncharacterized membrane protein YeaQ/YmgE (transglycosylase-associated protein family)
VLGLILGLVLTGLIVGALGRLAVPGRQHMGVGMTILVGIGGSLIGGLVSRALFGAARPGLHFLLAVGGAALIVALVSRRRTV